MFFWGSCSFCTKLNSYFHLKNTVHNSYHSNLIVLLLILLCYCLVNRIKDQTDAQISISEVDGMSHIRIEGNKLGVQQAKEASKLALSRDVSIPSRIQNNSWLSKSIIDSNTNPLVSEVVNISLFSLNPSSLGNKFKLHEF